MENKDNHMDTNESQVENQDGVTKMTLFVHDVYEAQIERLQENAKKWRHFCIALLVALVLSNFAWLIYESQFDDIVMTQTADTDTGGNASVTGAVGNIYNGTSESDNTGQTEKE